MSILERLFHRPPRGTITLLPEGRIVFGFPTGYEPSQQEVEHLRVILDEWLDDPRHNPAPLILPFAVDVTDHRTRF